MTVGPPMLLPRRFTLGLVVLHWAGHCGWGPVLSADVVVVLCLDVFNTVLL